MTSQGDALSKKLERVKKSVQELPTASSTLNQATDQLGKSVSGLDATLKNFNLGVPTWVQFSLWQNEVYYHHEDLGYAKIGGKWGVAIRTVSGRFKYEDQEEEIEQWLFNDAPRLHRVNAVEKIPELLEELLKTAGEMAKTITEKAQEVDFLTAGIREIVDQPGRPTAATLGRNLMAHQPAEPKSNKKDEKAGS